MTGREQPADDGDSNSADEGGQWTLGLVPSPGHCEEVASRIKDTLPGYLRDHLETESRWAVEIESDPLSGSNVDIDNMLNAITSRKTRAGWDIAIALTDLPIREERKTIVAQGASSSRVAVLSIPALGVIRVDQRVMSVIVQLIGEMRAKGSESEGKERTDDILITAPWILGTLGLLAGMVYANQPWTLFPSFKTTVATAFATGGYGLIFSSLWEIGNTYGYARLITLMFVSMAILVFWIILSHRLWETREADVSQYQRSLYNATTVATIAAGVAFAYVILFALLLAAAFVYIPSSMLESTIQMPVMPMNYVRVAWVTASVATIAGAIGAGLEDTEAVRNATFGWRQINRWREHNEDVEERKDDG